MYVYILCVTTSKKIDESHLQKCIIGYIVKSISANKECANLVGNSNMIYRVVDNLV